LAAQSARNLPGPTSVGRRFLPDRSTRTISQFSQITVPEYIDDRIKENTNESLDEVKQLAVGSAEHLEQIAHAREILKPKDRP
jgi:hypothetical protein